MKKLLFLSALLFALAGQAAAQTAPSSIAVVRIRSGEWAVVTRDQNKSETVHLLPEKSNADKLTAGNEGLHKLISQLYQEGYVLQTSFVNGQYSEQTTLIFSKPKP